MPSDAAKVLKILAWTWGPLIHWTPPRIERTVGPYIPDAFEAYAGKVESCLRECREWAEKMAIENRLDSFDEQGRAILGPLRDQQDQLAKRANNIAAGPPVWAAGGLGNPQYYADFEYWSKMPFFPLHEATCLTLGIEPKHLDEGVLTTSGPSDTAKGDVVAFAQRRREQLRRQFDPYNQKNKIPRNVLVDWVKTIELEVHIGMQTIGKNIGGLDDPSAAPISAHQNTSAQQVESREKASMAKLIVAMAMDSYGYSPKQARSPIPQEIESIAAKLGLEISHDTIRKYLRMGASLLPKD
jgi:hypothetical protein